MDSGTPDSGTSDSGTSDSGTSDSGTPDSGTSDSGTPDSGTSDSGTPDSGTPDSGSPDSGTPDSGTPDSGTPDSGSPDSGTPDSGTPDSGTPDSGTPECVAPNNCASVNAAGYPLDSCLVGRCVYLSPTCTSARQYGDTTECVPADPDPIAGLPSCATTFSFPISPVPVENLSYLVPLGNMNPFGHPLPTDHMYWELKDPHGPWLDTTIVAPADATIFYFESTTTYVSAVVTTKDFALKLAPCHDVRLEFAHIKDVPDSLQTQLVASASVADCMPMGNVASGSYQEWCRYSTTLPVSQGTVLAHVGGGRANSTGFDVHAVDLRGAALPFANPLRYYGSSGDDLPSELHKGCASDLFTTAVRSSLTGLLGGCCGANPRTVTPVCGAWMQDLPNTAQGNWYLASLPLGPTDSASQLGLAHDNVDPTQAVLDIGGGFFAATLAQFTPLHSGTRNRDWSDVTADGHIYCYDNLPDAYGNGALVPGRFLVQMPGGTALNIEHQATSCSDPIAFTSPTSYRR